MSNTENSDNGKYDSVEVAKYIAAYWNDKGESVNITKIQKLLYIAYGTWLAIKNERLCNEQPQAWPYGPVFPTTRNRLLKLNIDNIGFNDVADEKLKDDEEIKKLFDMIYKSSFGAWAANQLSAWSHQKGSPWEHTTSQLNFCWGNRMDDDRIKKYFKKEVLSE